MSEREPPGCRQPKAAARAGVAPEYLPCITRAARGQAPGGSCVRSLRSPPRRPRVICDHIRSCQQLFAQTIQDRSDHANDLVPFWIYEPQGDERQPFKIERWVLVLRLSREIPHLERLRRSLLVYRSVFGQPRGQELVAFLRSRLCKEQIEEFVRLSTIDLSPSRVPGADSESQSIEPEPELGGQ